MAHRRVGGKPVKGVMIFMEGEGGSRDGKVALRQGMDALLAPFSIRSPSKLKQPEDIDWRKQE